jgi:hypothetical protein
MVSVPGFLLRRLYVKGSLRNIPEGFEFQLKNTLGSGYARQLLPLTVDGQQAPLEQTVFLATGEAVPFSQVSQEKPLTLAMNRSVTVQVKGMTLPPGPHRLGMSFQVQGLGTLSFDFTDVVAEGAE